ncbi:hypothetical protein OS493_001485 [Desmophyllum pertusum]|uniref:HECT domain-containing protein n=1 Tax=Desmophyllum pertusum TaxID=174260 RepID=A0A9X0D0M0_9CNID|nr:hypothetical protein OS493_001485 [Desmophyllum pertusum]
MENKIQPKSTLKVVFSGESAIDEGGPKRELFSELLMIAKDKFFKNGKPVNSTVALNAGDFKTCGKAMGMSVLQGGPAPNFLAPEVASYLVGAPLSPSENQDSLLRTAAERLSSATTDEQVKATLTCDDVLDVLESIGYSGIPQKETVAGIQPIIQSICIKDQLSQYLPQLVQIESGLYECGILSHMRRNTETWKPVFANGNCFTITADEFLDQMIVNFSESQIRKDAEMNTYKFFSDVMASIDAGGIEGVSVMDLVKWMTGSSQIPPLGFPKKFTVEFVHGCLQGCCCQPTASTCDITMKLPVHIDNEKAMEDMIVSALKDSYGFALI